MRKIYIGADSAGFRLKEEVKEHLNTLGYEVCDLGCDSEASCHYPIFASAVCEKVQADLQGSFGILICGTGIGMSMCANKFNGIRAALCSDTFSARMTRVHNNANVLILGARTTSFETALAAAKTFLTTAFEGGRHEVRVQKLERMNHDFEK